MEGSRDWATQGNNGAGIGGLGGYEIGSTSVRKYPFTSRRPSAAKMPLWDAAEPTLWANFSWNLAG